MEKSTDELMKLLRNKPNADDYLEQNENELLQKTPAGLLEDYLKEKELKKSDVIRASNLDRIYAYQIFSGRVNPGRNKLLCLAFGMKLTVEETQRLLRVAQTSPLYPRDPRDVFILECMFQGKDLIDCNETLEAHGLPILE